MFRRRLFRAAAFCLLTCLPAIAAAGGSEQLRTFVATTLSARAGFVQSVAGKSGRKPQVSQGTLAFARPGKFRWTYDKPYDQVIVGDGKKLWVYDKDLNQVTVKTLDRALGSSPAALLAGGGALEKNFALKDAGSAEGLEMVDATPLVRDGSFSTMRIGLSDNLPRIMRIEDSFGQTTTLIFSRFDRNLPLPADLFRFAPPAGADVVGE